MKKKKLMWFVNLNGYNFINVYRNIVFNLFYLQLKEFFHNMGPSDKVIVFFGKKCKVDDIGSDLALSGVACQSIHGGREQADREQALEDIKKGDVNILLATDVASRGIDIEDIT